MPRETCSFGLVRKLGERERPLITKWCYDTENEPISQHLKRRGKLTFDAGDNSFSENDLEDININNSWFLQEAESVKNVPGHGPTTSSDNKSNHKNTIEQKTAKPLSLVDSNYAFENSINAGTDGDFVGHDFNSFQEMINHEFHQNIPSTFQAETGKHSDIKEANDMFESKIEMSAKTLTNIDRTKNEEDEKSSSSRLRVIFPDTKAESTSTGGNKNDNESDAADNADTRPLIEKISVKTNIKELTRQPLAATESLQSTGDSSRFPGPEETTIASRLEPVVEPDKLSFHVNDEELQTETFKGRAYNTLSVYIYLYSKWCHDNIISIIIIITLLL